MLVKGATGVTHFGLRHINSLGTVKSQHPHTQAAPIGTKSPPYWAFPRRHIPGQTNNPHLETCMCPACLQLIAVTSPKVPCNNRTSQITLQRNSLTNVAVVYAEKETNSLCQLSMGCLFNKTEHDDVMKWKHFPRYWPLLRGIHRSPVNSPHKGQWRGALMFSLMCVWINLWVNTREAGDLRHHRAHYDVIVMRLHLWNMTVQCT